MYSCLPFGEDTTYDDIAPYFWLLEEFAASGADFLHVDSQMNSRWNKKFEIPVTHCRGNISYATTNPLIKQQFDAWSWDGHRDYFPKSMEDLYEESFLELLQEVHLIADQNVTIRTAFPAEFHEEEREEQDTNPMDDPDSDTKEKHLTSIPKEVEDKVADMDGVESAKVQIVFDPPWTQDMMSEAAKLECGFL